MKTQKIDFLNLIGSHYNLEIKMMVLDWMLKTGEKHRQSTGRWTVDGINKFLFDYSANDHNSEISIPRNSKNYSNFFDSIFSRAVFKKPNKPIREWRESESIYPEKYRMLKKENCFPRNENHPYLSWLINDLFSLTGSELKKEIAHPDYENRTIPKIISFKIYTYGNGWNVKYLFSFLEFDYEPGWQTQYNQKENESISEFLIKTYNDIMENHILISELKCS